MPEVNIPLLRKAVEWAEAEAAKPEELCQWYQDTYSRDPILIGRSPECGTCFCIAGYVAHQTLRPGEKIRGSRIVDESGELVEFVDDRAEVELGINAIVRDPLTGDAVDLFGGGNTIQEVREIAELIAGERL